jgi:hypothetical protein
LILPTAQFYYSNSINRLIASLIIVLIGHFKVLQWVIPNVYVIDIPPDHGISFTFNVEELLVYKDNQLLCPKTLIFIHPEGLKFDVSSVLNLYFCKTFTI